LAHDQTLPACFLLADNNKMRSDANIREDTTTTRKLQKIKTFAACKRYEKYVRLALTRLGLGIWPSLQKKNADERWSSALFMCG
jgi:hypothetical protein